MAYTSQANLEAFLKRDLTSQEETLLTVILTTVDNWINNQLDDTGWNSDSASTKYYDGNSCKILEIDPCKDITAVTTVDDEEAVVYTYELNEEFEAKPRNEDVKTYLELRSTYLWPIGVGNIAVTATFSRGTTAPDDIVWLATYLSAQMVSDVVKKGIKSEAIEGYNVAYLGVLKGFTFNNEIVQDILSRYISDEVRI